MFNYRFHIFNYLSAQPTDKNEFLVAFSSQSLSDFYFAEMIFAELFLLPAFNKSREACRAPGQSTFE